MNGPSLSRLAKVAHYVIARTEPARLGAVKLNKVLWFADVENYRRTGRSITGLSAYVRLPRGPVPDGIQIALEELTTSGAISIRRQKVFSYDRFEYVWLKEPDVSGFSAQEIDLLNQAIAAIESLTASEVSEYTHQDPLWTELANRERMSVGAASVISKSPNEQELAWANDALPA